MITGIGIDIIELKRIKRLMNKDLRFVRRILTDTELSLFSQIKSEQRKIEFMAGRFAAKEAFAKATGRGIGKLSFRDIEVLRHSNRAPRLCVQGYEAKNIFVSISHSKEYAVAQVIIDEN